MRSADAREYAACLKLVGGIVALTQERSRSSGLEITSHFVGSSHGQLVAKAIRKKSGEFTYWIDHALAYDLASGG